MDFRDQFLVKPGSKVRLKHMDTGFHGKHESEDKAARDLVRYKDELTSMQRRLYGDRNQALLIVLQGIDGSGKDGTCWHVISAMNPLGVQVTDFKQPTPDELAHDFLWRVHLHAPARGRVAVFNRSHYESVLVERVHKLVPKPLWKARYDRINEFERLLHEQSDTVIIKFLLAISKDEQLDRFKARLDDPGRQWKISESDYAERELWDDYMDAFEDALENCSTKHAPWYVIPSDHKWFRNLAVSQIIVDTMKDMNLRLPEPKVDLEKIRRLYHSETKAAKAKAGRKAR